MVRFRSRNVSDGGLDVQHRPSLYSDLAMRFMDSVPVEVPPGATSRRSDSKFGFQKACPGLAGAGWRACSEETRSGAMVGARRRCFGVRFLYNDAAESRSARNWGHKNQ